MLRNKSKYIMKRLFTLMSILVLVSNSFAAIVSDNDGSAFTTKSEFEALKNNFANQIDNYNLSIDSKIDGAIANYLAGITIKQKTIKSIINADWDTVVMESRYYKNAYQYPNLSLFYSALWQSTSGNDFSELWKNTAWWYGSINYNRTTSSTNNQRLLCDAGEEKSTYPDYITWIGRSADLKETITASLIQSKIDSNSCVTGFMSDSTYGGTKQYYINLMNFINGYWPNAASSAVNVWKPGTMYLPQNRPTLGSGAWKTSGSGAGYITTNVPYSTATFTNELLVEDNKTINDQHLLTFDNISFDQFTDVDWVHTILRGTTNTLGETDFLNATSRASAVRLSENAYDKSTGLPKGGNGSYGRFASRSINGWYAGETTGNVTRAPISIGLINKTYDSEHIRQTADKISIVESKKTYETPKPLNLYNGLPVMYGDVDKETHLIWKPVFKTYNDGAEVNYEVCVELIMGGLWLTGDNKEASAKVCKNDNQTNDWLVTASKTCTFDFDVPATGIVYAKWWLADNTIKSNNKWRIELDLTKCGTYEYQSYS